MPNDNGFIFSEQPLLCKQWFHQQSLYNHAWMERKVSKEFIARAYQSKTIPSLLVGILSLLKNLTNNQRHALCDKYFFKKWNKNGNMFKQELGHSQWQMPPNKCTVQMAYLFKKKIFFKWTNGRTIRFYYAPNFIWGHKRY